MRNHATLVSRIRILVVEDATEAREIYALMFGHAGYEVVTVGSIGAARATVRDRRPDLVVLDCHLPDGSGLDLLRAWRGTDEMSAVPVVVVSAFAEDAVVDEASAAGADAFLVKPCTTDALMAHVSRLLRLEPPTTFAWGPLTADETCLGNPKGPLTIVYPLSEDRPFAHFDSDEGRLHARCLKCFRVSPTLGRLPGQAERRVISLGWSARVEGWWCPVCIERHKTQRHGRAQAGVLRVEPSSS